MKKIESLTEEQEKYLPIFHKEWFDIGTNTSPANRGRTENAITKMYEYMGKSTPLFIWCDSPLTSTMAINFLKNTNSIGDSLGDSLRNSLGDSLSNSLSNSLRDSLRGSLGDSLRNSLGDSLWSSLWNSLRNSLSNSLWSSLRNSLVSSLGDSLSNSLGDSLRNSLGDSLRNSLGDSLSNSLWSSLRDLESQYDYTYTWGQHDSYWIAFYKFCEKIGVKYDPLKSQHLDWHSDIAQSMMWWWPYENMVICCERPDMINFDEQNRLHSENQAAVSFRDGWKIYAWHGVRVEEYVIMRPEEITIDKIESVNNQEIKRVMIERYGMGRYMIDSGCEEIHRDEFGILLNKKRINMPDMRMVKVVNGSYEGLWRKDNEGNMHFTPDLKDGQQYRKEYFLRVHPDTKTSLEGVASTYGMKPEEYRKLAIRT